MLTATRLFAVTVTLVFAPFQVKIFHLKSAIDEENELLTLRSRADLVIDTSEMSRS